MERKIIISLVSGYLVSMLPIWMIDSRMQEIILIFAVSFCVLSGLIWIEERMQDMKKALTSANVRAKRKNNLFKQYKENTGKCQGGLKMLKTDYKGFGEFMEKNQNSRRRRNKNTMRNTTADVAERNFRFYFSNSGGRSSVLNQCVGDIGADN